MKYPSGVAKHAHPDGSPRAPAATTAAAGWRLISPPLSLFIMFLDAIASREPVLYLQTFEKTKKSQVSFGPVSKG